MTSFTDLLKKLENSTNSTNSSSYNLNPNIKTFQQLNSQFSSVNSSTANAINNNLMGINKKIAKPTNSISISKAQQQSFINFANTYGVNAGQIQSETEPLQLNITNKGTSLTSYAIPASYTKSVLPSSTVITNAGLLKAMGYNSNVNAVQFTNIYDKPLGNPNIAPVQTIVSSTPPIIQAFDNLGTDISNFFKSLAKDLSSLGSGLLSVLDFIAKYWEWILLGIAGIVGIVLYSSAKTRSLVKDKIKGGAGSIKERLSAKKEASNETDSLPNEIRM